MRPGRLIAQPTQGGSFLTWVVHGFAIAVMNHVLQYRRLRTDRRDAAVVYDPPAQHWPAMVTENRRRLDGMVFHVQGISGTEVRRRGCDELRALAEAYMGDYAAVPAMNGPLIMSGHQPEFFHPGVWAKNFIAQALAERVQGTAVHVIIDNDLVRQTTLPVPTGTPEAPRVVVEPFDQPTTPVPHEFRVPADCELLASFAERVAARLKHVLPEPPLIFRWWPHVLRDVEDNLPLAQALSRARHRMELSWGRSSVEVPLSRLCQSEAFCLFLADLLQRGSEVRQAVNDRLAEYRQVHRLRSAAQPLPDLRLQQGWTESPFWFWSQQAPQRKALWWKRENDQLVLGEPGVPRWTFATASPSPRPLHDGLRTLQREGICFRPRALTNSMFLRLFMSDLFVHGIGGGKYDQITDLLMRDLYGLDPPRFAICSQTTWLPVPFRPIGQQEINEKKQQQREMYFHPERFLRDEIAELPQVSSWLTRKRTAAGPCQTLEERRWRHREISAANAALRKFLQEKPEELQRQLVVLQRQESVSRIWSSREWSSVLFPESFLRGRLLDLDLPDP